MYQVAIDMTSNSTAVLLPTPPLPAISTEEEVRPAAEAGRQLYFGHIAAPELLSELAEQLGVSGATVNARLTQARRPKTRVHLLEDGDVLFDCDLRTDDGS